MEEAEVAVMTDAAVVVAGEVAAAVVVEIEVGI